MARMCYRSAMPKSAPRVDTDNITIRINRGTGSNVDVDNIVSRKLDSMIGGQLRASKSDATCALIRDGAAAAELLGTAGELVAAVDGLKSMRASDRTIARQVLDGIIGALRRGDYQLARDLADLARWEYFAERNDLGST